MIYAVVLEDSLEFAIWREKWCAGLGGREGEAFRTPPYIFPGFLQCAETLRGHSILLESDSIFAPEVLSYGRTIFYSRLAENISIARSSYGLSRDEKKKKGKGKNKFQPTV